MEEGYEKGDLCNRNGCKGIIEEKDIDGCCSCHIAPPCGYCETNKGFCDICGWDGQEEQESYISKFEESITQEQKDKWEKDRKGTFGGRFKRFNKEIGRFEYIAYTD